MVAGVTHMRDDGQMDLPVSVLFEVGTMRAAAG